ncbi:Glutaryl-CoA dehydrogenase [Variovorax sp. PBL-H6]|uniref:acyl-CoA dehydrogenase family protein n=1 Tax=Variovorax sp. PBL-H6 TaxID=434009 RepID=UPI001317E869|nr:acyl-CoA dehydrogenase family protein [Variovorax sp. PBL-H6]VTU31725.1 Glutaryl-CoA dehydrogenase [Variovorax sp. PBL-H6]
MDFALTPAQAAFRNDVRAFIQERLPQDIRKRMRAGHPARKQDVVLFQRILNERGWAAPHWPRKYGGAELGQVERLILVDELFRAPAPMPSIFNVVMLGPLLMKFGTPEQCDHFLPKLANLDLWFCQGFSEPGAGSDLAALRTSARREGDHYVVNGQKIWTSTAHYADWAFCLVRTGQAARKQDGISFLLVDLRLPGIRIRPIVSIDGAHSLNEVFFDEVKVPVEHLVGEEGRGWDCAKFLLGNERTGIANVGLCRERLDFARELARTLTQNGRPLIDDAGLRAELAVLDAEIRALEITNWRLLLAPETSLGGAAFASVLKLKGTEIQQEVVALVARLAGPAALERRASDSAGSEHWAAPLAPRYLQSRAASIYGGASEIQKDILAKAALG